MLETANTDCTEHRGPASVDEYACTMMLGLASERLVGVAHVGDGCVVAGDGEEWRLLSEPDNGEFANETRFLTNPRNLPAGLRWSPVPLSAVWRLSPTDCRTWRCLRGSAP